MRGTFRAGIVVTAAIAAAVTVYLSSTLPRRALSLDGQLPASHIVGAYHIHTDRSDGTGTVDQVAQAASRAGLQFIVLTDHGDGTRAPEPPAYRHGVLVIDAVELNTREGHVVALGLSGPTPYPLAGLAQDVIEDIHRLGGKAVIAHPDSPRNELAWRGGQGIWADGIEWVNVDSEWRDESLLTLLRLGAQSIARPAESIAALFSRPVASLQRWDAAARVRPMFGIAALDAHANIPWRETEEPRRRSALAWPSYETMFRTLVQTAIVDDGLSGEAGVDSRRVLSALTTGKSYSTIRAHAWPSSLEFTAQQADVTVVPGARVAGDGEAMTFRARVPTAPGARLTLLRDGQPLATGQGRIDLANVTQPGAYRVEAYVPDSVTPWIVSNPITIQGTGGPPPAGGPQAAGTGTIEERSITPDAPDWTIEQDVSSEASHEREAERLRFAYRLGGGRPLGQYAAVVYGDDSGAGIETIRFVGQASAPMRLSVQIRLPDGRGRNGQRWRRSVYLDTTPRTISLRLQDFEPADRPTSRRPIVTPIQSLLFVVDTVNSIPGAEGTIWLSAITLGTNRLDP